MRILFYQYNQLRDITSAGVHINELVSNLCLSGHKIIYTNGEYHQLDISSKITEPLPMTHQKSTWGKMVNQLPFRLFKGEAHILFHLKNEILLFFSAIFSISKHKPEVIYRRHSLFGSEHILSTIFGIPVINEVNGIIRDEMRISRKGNSLSLKLIDLIEKLTVKMGNMYIVVTPKLKELLNKEYGVEYNKIIIIENGANIDLFKPVGTSLVKRKLKLEENINYICYSGNFARWQGVENLIRAMPEVIKQIPNMKLLLVGDGETKNELQEMVKSLEISDGVLFTGKVSYGQVPLYINVSDICVIPKKPYDGGLSPLKLCEYMACEKPVVASRIDGLEILEEQKAGLLVEPENPQELSGAIVRLLRDPDLRSLMGANGRKYVLENRSWESISKKVAQACLDAVKEYGKSRK